MAEKEDQYGSCGSDSTITTNPDQAWTQQPAMPLWCLKKESVPLSESGRLREEAGEESSRKSTVAIDDSEDESGLELSLGLSLGGPLCKPKARSGQKDGGTGTEDKSGGNDSGGKNGEDISSRKLTRRGSDASIARTQAFWQEFDICREGSQREPKPSGNLASDVHLLERYPASVSSLSSSISPPTSLGLQDTWRTTDISSAGEESKAGMTFPFWKPMHEKPLQPDQGNGKDEVPMFQPLPRPSSETATASPAAWSLYGQSALAMSLLERFKDIKDENPRAPFPVSSKECKTLISSMCSDTVEGGQLQSSKEEGDVPSPDDGFVTSDSRATQESMELLRKQKKQEARKRRKAFMEEQKLQKKAKEEDEGRFVSGPTSRPMGSRPSSPPGSKLSPSLQTNPREASSPSDSQEVGSGNVGLHRTSSGFWSRARDVGSSPEKTPDKGPVEKNSEDDKQMVDNRKGGKDRSEKEKLRDVDMDKEGNTRQESEHKSPGRESLGKPGEEGIGSQTTDPSYGSRENAAPQLASAGGPEINKVQADPAWVQRMVESQLNAHSAYQMAAALMENKEQVLKGLPDLNARKGKNLENATAVDRDRLKAFVQPSSERNGRSSRVEPVVGDSKKEDGNRPNAAVVSHAPPGLLMAYSQQPNFPLMHRAYPFPMPVADPNGLTYPIPYPFPYMMQYAHVESSAQDRPAALALPTPFPTVSSHLPYPVVGDVPTLGWAPMLRPQTTPPHSPPRTLVRSSSEVAIEEKRSLQGAKGGENVRNISPTKDASKAGHSLIRTSSSGSIHGQGGAFARLRSSPSLPPTPQFGPVRTRSDVGDFVYRDGSNVMGNSAFASLVAAVEASQGLSAAVASVNTMNKQPGTTQRTGGTKLERTSSRPLTESVEEPTGGNSSSSKVIGQQQGDAQHGDSVSGKNSVEEEKVTHGSRFQQGTTSLPEGLIRQMGQEGSCLKAGCDSKQTFGGSGSSPDLPWVTCKGAGPNGKAVSGVLYKYNKGQVRIVCACHGRHMSPSEFVQHAGNEDLSNPEKSIVVNAFPLGGQAAAAQR